MDYKKIEMTYEKALEVVASADNKEGMSCGCCPVNGDVDCFGFGCTQVAMAAARVVAIHEEHNKKTLPTFDEANDMLCGIVDTIRPVFNKVKILSDKEKLWISCLSEDSDEPTESNKVYYRQPEKIYKTIFGGPNKSIKFVKHPSDVCAEWDSENPDTIIVRKNEQQ